MGSKGCENKKFFTTIFDSNFHCKIPFKLIGAPPPPTGAGKEQSLGFIITYMQ